MGQRHHASQQVAQEAVQRLRPGDVVAGKLRESQRCPRTPCRPCRPMVQRDAARAVREHDRRKHRRRTVQDQQHAEVPVQHNRHSLWVGRILEAQHAGGAEHAKHEIEDAAC